VAVAAIIAIVAAIYMGYAQFGAGGSSIPHSTYFTSNDGQTFFVDSIDKVPPFEEAGKECVRAHVYESHGKRFVGYMAKMTADGKAAVEKYQADLSHTSSREQPASWAGVQASNFNGWLYKEPGEKQWKPGGIIHQVIVKGPDGQPADEVSP
jgi:hypothetical protein